MKVFEPNKFSIFDSFTKLKSFFPFDQIVVSILQIFTLFYFGVVYFTIEFEKKKKKQGSNYGQIFPKIVHQKIITVFEMQYSFCQTLNAIQTNIK